MKLGELQRGGSYWAFALAVCAIPASPVVAVSHGLRVAVAADGRYSVGSPDELSYALTASVAAKVDGHWLRSDDFPKHTIVKSETQADLGEATEWQVTASGLAGAPRLVYRLRAYHDAPFAEVQVTVENAADTVIHVEAIRVADAAGQDVVDLAGPPAQDRVLSDSFSEDRPAMRIHDLADAPVGMHRAVGSQLIYNRESHESLFMGALTSDKFLTILRVHLDQASGAEPRIAAYEVDSTGTTEMEKENSLRNSPTADQIPLGLTVAAGGTIASERVLLSVDSDYHGQLETYGSLIRSIHHARVSAPPLMGWWSWTAFYFGLNEGVALTNAQWESEHLRPYGYKVFHIDEGYQYARGEYTTSNATLFPHGMTALEYKIRGLSLVPGIWTAPFEVSERSWVYEHHPNWLVKNAQGQPIPTGTVVNGMDRLFVLDTTNPSAQEYLRKTYSTLVQEWGIHYIKLDFMDDSAIEGYYFKPGTTAMEAQRIGLGIIRSAVGNNVFLDKDGSVMMNPVGYVDYGRISQDTGHTFDATKDAATGIAARYYMDRNFFVSDPDAFAVSTQTISDQSWHDSRTPATLDAARASMALAAVSGGMLEIGDNLPSLEHTPDRVALIANQDLIDMVRLGKASTPIDLMDYREQDGQPTIFLLKESSWQSVLTVFNWTKQPAQRTISLERLGLVAGGQYAIYDVLEGKDVPDQAAGAVEMGIPAQSVRVLKLINRNQPVEPPVVKIEHEESGAAGETLAFSAEHVSGDPVVAWQWDFGDGVTVEGAPTSHAWTEPGDYDVMVTAQGLSGEDAKHQFRVHIVGYMPTVFTPEKIQRLP